MDVPPRSYLRMAGSRRSFFMEGLHAGELKDAGVVELADTMALGAIGVHPMGVQISPPAP